MDGTTEPIIAVIGHPIAGNPSQLAIERALAHLQLEWRVLSFDVPEDHVHQALDGFSVLSIRGVLIDSSLATAAARWQVPSSDDRVDCLTRNNEGTMDASDQRKRLMASLFEGVSDSETVGLVGNPETTIETRRDEWFDLMEHLPILNNALLTSEDVTSDQLTSVKRVVVAPDWQGFDHNPELEQAIAQWFNETPKAILIDLSDQNPIVSKIDNGDGVILRCIDLQSMWLQRCLEEWTSMNVPIEIMSEAIEEYTGV